MSTQSQKKEAFSSPPPNSTSQSKSTPKPENLSNHNPTREITRPNSGFRDLVVGLDPSPSMDAPTEPTAQQQPLLPPPPVLMAAQQAYTANTGHGSVGPVIAVLAVIAILGVVAGMIGRLCTGRSVMGYGHFDVEGWMESKCSSCLDAHVDPPRPPRSRPPQPPLDEVPVAAPVRSYGADAGSRSSGSAEPPGATAAGATEEPVGVKEEEEEEEDEEEDGENGKQNSHERAQS